jgi:hypothetical protein
MNHKPTESFDPGIGATEELSLRVSVATLSRVLFEPSGDGEVRLALERKATAHKSENGLVVKVKSQPFGGAVRVKDLDGLHDLIGGFHFDSERSRLEEDFRIFIRPSDWPLVRDFCVEQFNRADDLLLETDPTRELVEEFDDALKIDLKTYQYIYQPVATIIEDDPAPTANIHAKGHRTARVYRIFEARILDSTLAQAMMANSESHSDQRLREIALEEAQRGGKGRANAILALSLKDVTDAYLAVPPEQRNTAILYGEHRLDETVAAVLEGVAVPKYRRL